jgi:hypothetical protein
MLKMAGKGSKDGHEIHLVILGLSHLNLDRLRAGQPITFAGDEVGLADTVQVMIFAGETEQAMAHELAELVGEKTEVKISNRLRS